MTDSLTTMLDSLTALVAGTKTDQLDDPTPCREWRVRDLLNHFIGGGHMFAAAFRGAPLTTEGEPPDLVGDDPLPGWQAARADFEQAIAEPGATERTVELPVGPVPGSFALQIAVTDLTIHAWDLARATGQAYEPPADIVAEADAFAHQLIAPEMRGTGFFGAEVTPAPGATPIERLVAFAGRRP